MRKGWMSQLGVAAAIGWLAVGGVATTGCAGEKDPIVQVQSNYIKKADLVGDDKDHPAEWYLRTTVIDVRRTNSFAFPGMQDDLRRIRWDIQENYLIARRSYEVVSGSDGKGASRLNKDGTTTVSNDGIIVAMYPIEKQFDIRRAYNEATGEEQNILVENDRDRKWFDREYIRVDWSQNLVSDPDFESLWYPKIFGEINILPVQYFESDPNSPNRPVMDSANGYFDVTSKFVVQAEAFQTWWGSIPACYIYNLYSGSDTTDCNDQEVTVRTSYMKVADRDYEAAESSGEKFAMFGTFNKERYGYDRGYGVTDTNFHQYMSRHNVWQKSHTATVCGAANASKAEEDTKCSTALAGSSCDMNAGKCTLPYEQRKIRTVPYFLDSTMPKDLETANQALVNEWNDAMKVAVAVTRETECRAAGGDKDACHAKHFDGETPKVESQVVVMCHNPVAAGDDQACGERGVIARQGDLRFNLIGWIDEALSAAPLGYGPDGSDPLTGEVVQATAYIYGASLDSYAAMTRDLVAIANGDMAPDVFAAGGAPDANLGTYDPKTAPKIDKIAFEQYGRYLQGKLAINKEGAMSDAEIAGRMSGIDASEFVATLGTKSAIGADATPAQRLELVNQIIANKGVAGAPGFGGAAEAQAMLDSKAKKLRGTGTEHVLTDDKNYLIENALSTTGDPKTLADQLSPFGGLGPLDMAQLNDMRRRHLESHGQCLFGADEFNAPHIEGLALKMKNKYQFSDGTLPADCKQPTSADDFDNAARVCRQKKVFEDLRWTIYKAVTEHEVGHTMALRHNFQGSWDSVNYHPNYWKLRTADGAHVNNLCKTAHDQKSDTCMGPRYLDPSSDAETGKAGQPGIEEFAYSSIMDYGYDFNTDLHGIGSYDKAAMKFIYGGVVETMDGSIAPANADKVSPFLSAPITEQWMVKGATGVEPVHYTKLAGLLNLYSADRCHEAGPGEQDDAVGGQVCVTQAKDHAFIGDMVSGEVTPGRFAAYYKSKTTGAMRWPYRFGTDEFAHYPHILRFDAGADLYEGATNVRALYEYRYVLDFYRRGRRGWIPYWMTGRLWDRYFSRFHSLGWLAANRTAQYSAMYPGKTADTNPALNSDDWGRGYVLASSVLFEALERSALRPQPGGYAVKAADPGQNVTMYEVPDFGGTPVFNVGVLDGRYVDEVFNNDVGGSFWYLSYLQRMGTYIEKPLSAITLSILFPPVDVQATADAKGAYLDGRNMLINFRTVMPQAYDRLYAGILGEDWDTIAPYVNRSAAAKDPNKLVPEVTYTQLWQKDVARPANATLIDPLVGYKMQGATMIYSLYFGDGDATQGLTNSMRVWVDGGPEGITVPASEKVTMFEPESGLTWVAHRLGTETIDGKVVEKGIGARMVVHGSQLMAAAYKVETDDNGMPKLDASGKVIWQKDAKPGEITSADALARFRKYVGVLNVERNALWDMGWGPLGYRD
jgi:hypothetical protein